MCHVAHRRFNNAFSSIQFLLASISSEGRCAFISCCCRPNLRAWSLFSDSLKKKSVILLDNVDITPINAIWTWKSICILFYAWSIWLSQTLPFSSSRLHPSFFYYFFLLLFLYFFLLVIIEIFLFSVFIHAKQGKKRLSRHLYQNRLMIIPSPALHMFTCTQLFFQYSVAADLWRLCVRVSVSICVQKTVFICMSLFVCICM